MADYTILRGYDGSREIFRIDRVGKRLEIVPPNTPVRDVDKLVFFYESQEICLALPLLPRTLAVTRDKDDVAIRCSMRAYTCDTKAQWIPISMRLGLDKKGTVKFAYFEVVGWFPVMGVTDLDFGALGSHAFTIVEEYSPFFAEAFGLRTKLTAAEVHVTLNFTQYITFSSSFELPNASQKLKPFGLRFDNSDLPLSLMNIIVRQPHLDGDALNQPLAWPANHWIVELDAPWSCVAKRWNDGVIEPYVTALHTVQDGRPVSFLPLLPDEPAEIWHAKFSLVDRARTKDLAIDDFTIRQAKTELPDGKVSIIPRTLELPPLVSVQNLVLELPALKTTAQEHSPLTIGATIEAINQDFPESDLESHNEGFFFSIVHTSTPAPSPPSTAQIVRVGALDLVFASKSAVTGVETGGVKVSFRPGNSPDLPGAPRIEELTLSLGALDIRPGNQDPIPGEEFNESSFAFSEPQYDAAFRRAVPLVIDRNPAAPTDALTLAVNESAIEHESQTIALKLSSQTSTARTVDALVVDTHPFLVARVYVDPSIVANTALTSEIANWSNRSSDLAWEIASGASGFDLVLPPQGIGETMERRSGDFLDATMTKVVPADFRFTPNARVRLQSSYFKQRFVEAPWNLRRVLGYPGQRAAGAGVERLDFELLYGVAAHVVNPHLRLAELAARLGHLPGRQQPFLPWDASSVQKDIFKSYRGRWQAYFPPLLSRLAILEPYEVDREGTLTLTDAEGVSYDLRPSGSGTGVHLADPIGRSSPPPPFSADGLRGGWSWGFESANVLDAVLRTPRSSSAILARPFFSALGGWGYQKASFDRNLSAIYSDTAMGRTFSISIERLGRISVLWNRAKHVIVYERTVMPTRQFAGEQDLLLGLPVVRKVREYVEILQDERSYPEFGESPIARGFVHASFFPEGSRRINVNSTWGEDVGRIGWKVPLWRRDADPSVYPRPSITAKVAGDHPDKLNPLTLSEPDKLYFFTNTEASQPPNSDLWPAVEGIDYPFFPKGFDLPTPDFGVGTPKSHEEEVVPAVVNGTGAFTFAVDATPHAVNVVEARAGETIGAVLQNVTLARGPIAATKTASTLAFVRDVMSEAERAVAALVDDDLDTLKKAAKERYANVKTELEKLVPPDLQLDTTAICARLHATLERELERAASANGPLVPIIDQLNGVLRAVRASTDAEFHRLYGAGMTIDDARAKLQQERQRLYDDAVVAIRSVQGAAGTAARSVHHAGTDVSAAKNAIDLQIAAIIALIGTANQWTDDLRAKVRGQTRTILDIIDRTEQSVDDAGQALTGAIPDNLRLLVRNVAAVGRRVAMRVISAASATTTILPPTVKGELSIAKPQLDAALDTVAKALSALKKNIDDAFIDAPLEKDLAALNTALEKIIQGALTWTSLFDDTKQIFTAFFDDLDETIELHVKWLRENLSTNLGKVLCDSLPSDLDVIRDAIAAQLDHVVDAIAAIFDDITPLPNDVAKAVERIAIEASRGISELATTAGRTLGDVATSGERVLRLVRAFGDVPRVPGLDFIDARSIAYHFVHVGKQLELLNVTISPLLAEASALLGEFTGQLNPLGTRIPTFELLDRIIPFPLQNFDLAHVLPDFAGLKLDGLFSNIRLPQIATDNVRITHGFDQQSMRGWVQVDVDVPFDQTITVLSIVGLTLTLVRARFRATSRIEAQAGRSPRQTFTGEIHGQWQLHIGGFELVSFVDTRLLFDDRGSLRFEVSPDRIRLQAALQFLSELMASFGYSESGFSIRALPTGIQSTLDLPLPDIQGGSFGLANLRLGALFQLDFAPEFQITTRFFIGSKTAPFSITIFILGGAGWVDARVRYVPRKETSSGSGVFEPEFESDVSVGITAAASLAIALGPIKGGIYAYFGITVDYHSKSGSTSNLRIGLLLMFRGEVSLLGFLSVGLCLALEGQYTSSGGLIGRGFISYSIKICWCVTINVSAEVSYTFGNASPARLLHASRPKLSRFFKTADSRSSPFENAATEYIDMFA